MNATGTWFHHCVPKKNIRGELVDGAPADSISAWCPSGWVQTKWFVRFVRFFKPAAADPVSVDGHYSHTRNLDVVVTAKEHSVATVSPPPHSTHKI